MHEKIKKKLSIIIPHYNTPQLLIVLLESIPDETDIEVIVVDDRSTVSLESCYEIIKTRNNIKWYVNSSSEKGAGVCRNKGIDKCNGKWIIFADADDYFVKGWINIVKEYYMAQEDLVYFVPVSVDLKTGKESKRHLYYKMILQEYLKKETLYNCTKVKTGFCTPWSKMYRGNLVRDEQVYFDEIMVSNDIMFVTRFAYIAKSIKVDRRNIYCVSRGGGTLTSKKNKDNYWTRVDVVVKRYKYLKGILSVREFKYAEINKYAIKQILDVFIEGWGINTLVNVLKKYKENGVRLFTWSLLNPFKIYPVFKCQISSWFEIIGYRKNNKSR